MKNNNTADKSSHSGLIEITPEYAEPKKSTKVLHAVAGVAGAAAVLTGAVFGIKFLNEHGGLKEGGSDEIRAGYSQNIYYAETPSASDPIDISDLSGKTLKFSDFTAKITSASYDGSYMRVDYEGTCEESNNRNRLIFEPQSTGYSNRIYENFAIFYRGGTDSENCDRYTIIKSFSLYSESTMELIPSYYPDRRPIERISDITVRIKNDGKRYIEQFIESEDMEISDGLDLPMLHISPNMLEIDPKTDEYALLNEKPEITALRSDGTQVKLIGVNIATSPSYFGADHYGYSGQYFYITPDPDDGDLTEMKAFIVNGKMYEVTAEPMAAVTTTILENGEILGYVITSTTAAVQTVYETSPYAEDTTATPSHSGYYEGEAALDILKQYAGNDYCYPLEEQITEDVKYRTHDEMFGPDTSGDYRFTIKAQECDPIFSVTGGTVVDVDTSHRYANSDSEYKEGFYVTIQSPDGRKWRYSHCSTVFVNVGDTVKAGDKIAAVGLTGFVTGAHLAISFPDSEVIDPVAVEGGIVGIAQNIE